VADVWRARAESDQAAGPTFRRYRDWTARAADTLLATRALTNAGERLVRGMAAAVDPA
jgi:HEXXH motif-containing protein